LSEAGRKNKILFPRHLLLWANFGWGQNLPINFKLGIKKLFPQKIPTSSNGIGTNEA